MWCKAIQGDICTPINSASNIAVAKDILQNESTLVRIMNTDSSIKDKSNKFKFSKPSWNE